jgi:hypothetical protein
MGNRACPLCFARVPQTLVLTCGDELACPCCHTVLELSRSSRALSALVGLLAAFAAAHLVLQLSPTGRWVLPMVGAILAYALASVLLLLFFSDLVVLPKTGVGHFPQAHR